MFLSILKNKGVQLDTINKRLQNKLCDRIKIEAILSKVEVYLYKIFS